MSWLKGITLEIFGLFVEDGSLAVAVIAWLVLLGLQLPQRIMPAWCHAPLLGAGLLAILIENVLRAARRVKVG